MQPSSRFRAAVLAVGLLGLGVLPLAGDPQPTPAISIPLQGDLEKDAVGVQKARFRRKSVATWFDSDADKLREVGEDTPRFEARPGHPGGKNRGLIVEAASTNYLTNSSFEDGATAWRTEGAAAVAEEGAPVHGRRAVKAKGQGGYWLHKETVLVPAEAPSASYVGCLSVYCSTGDERPERSVRPVIFAVAGCGSAEVCQAHLTHT